MKWWRIHRGECGGCRWIFAAVLLHRVLGSSFTISLLTDPTPTFPLKTNIAALATEKALDETRLEHRLVFYLSLCYYNPDFLGWWGDQSMNRFDLLSLYEMKLEPFDEDSKKHEPFSDWEPPSGTFTFTSKPKRLVSEAWKLFNVLWTETIRIKPEKYYRVSFFFTGKSYLTFCS